MSLSRREFVAGSLGALALPNLLEASKDSHAKFEIGFVSQQCPALGG